MSKRARNIIGGILAAIGLGLVLLEVSFHVMAHFTHTQYELNHVVLLVAAIIGFAGFYALDSKGAKDAGDFIVGSVERVGSIVRFGRRKTDPAGVVVQPPVVAVPAAVTAERQGAPKSPPPIEEGG